jgi:cell division transport system ATP-binding protein
MAMLEFKKVSKIYGKIEALSEISFEIERGEFVFVTGPSGAGKTTLLKLIIREVVPSSGEILFDGREVHSLKKKEIPLLRRDVGAVFQDYKLLGERTIAENVQVALAVKGVSKDEWEARVEQVLKLVGLIERAELFPSQLSGGELQRAALARALVVNPKLIFADEPTGNLDEGTTSGIMELLSKINREGKTVIVATHDMDLVDKMNKRKIELEKGRVVSDSGQKKKKAREKEK